jgi:hypothetical protein
LNIVPDTLAFDPPPSQARCHQYSSSPTPVAIVSGESVTTGWLGLAAITGSSPPLLHCANAGELIPARHTPINSVIVNFRIILEIPDWSDGAPARGMSVRAPTKYDSPAIDGLQDANQSEVQANQ